MFPHTFFHDTRPSPQPLRSHQGKSEGDKDGGKRIAPVFPSLPSFPLGTPALSPSPLLAPCLASFCLLPAFSDPCLLSPRLILCFPPFSPCKAPASSLY